MGEKGRIFLRFAGVTFSLALLAPSAAPARPPEPRPTALEVEPELIEYDQPVEDPAWRTTVRSKSIAEKRGRAFGMTDAITGTAQLPVALVDFSDNPAEKIHPPKAFDDMLFSKNYPHGAGSMRDYYLDQSGGLFDVQGQVSKAWERAELKYSSYVGTENGLQAVTPNAQSLVRETAKSVDDEFNFCDFDFDGDGYVDTFFVVHAGPGAEETSGGGPGSGTGIWSHLSYLSPNVVTDDVCADGERARIGYYAIQPEEHISASLSAPGAPERLISIGVFAHEFGHALGLPDLYDIDYDSNGGVGSWDLMASGAWGFEGFRPWRPVPLSAWSKMHVGWAIPQDVTEDTLAQAFTSADAPRDGAFTGIYRLTPRGDVSSKEYFLIEYRDDASPFSVGMPTGVAVWHVNENKLSGDNLDNSDQSDRLLELVQADGLDELGGYDSSEYGDDGDLFPGSSQRTHLDAYGPPDSRLRDGNHSGVALRGITLTPDGAIADLYINDLLEAPPAPSDLTASRSGYDVRLAWKPSAEGEVTEQRIYRASSPTGAATRVGVVGPSSTTFLDDTAPEGVTSYYTIRSFNGTESEPSQQVSIAVPLGPQPPSDIEVFHGALSGSLTKLRSKGDNGVVIASRLLKGSQTVDYDLIFDLGEIRKREFVLEIRPSRKFRTRLFIGDWTAGEYKEVGSFTIAAGDRKRIRFRRTLRNISDEGQVRIGFSLQKTSDFRHALDRVLLRFPS